MFPRREGGILPLRLADAAVVAVARVDHRLVRQLEQSGGDGADLLLELLRPVRSAGAAETQSEADRMDCSPRSETRRNSSTKRSSASATLMPRTLASSFREKDQEN